MTFETRPYQGPFTYELTADSTDREALAVVFDVARRPVTTFRSRATEDPNPTVSVQGQAMALAGELNDAYNALLAQSGAPDLMDRSQSFSHAPSEAWTLVFVFGLLAALAIFIDLVR